MYIVVNRLKVAPDNRSHFLETLKAESMPILQQNSGLVECAFVDAGEDTVIEIWQYESKAARDAIMNALPETAKHSLDSFLIGYERLGRGETIFQVER